LGHQILLPNGISSCELEGIGQARMVRFNRLLLLFGQIELSRGFVFWLKVSANHLPCAILKANFERSGSLSNGVILGLAFTRDAFNMVLKDWLI